MTFLRSHIVLMFLYAVSTAVFFAFLWRDTPRRRWRMFVIIFLSLFAGGIFLSWLMYPLPRP